MTLLGGHDGVATYAIGDVQGCFDELQRLLKKIAFNPSVDRLWFVGDLVNRGPKSLAVLRFVRSLGERAVTVLGNHDLHLVAAVLSGDVRRKDTFQDVLDADDRDELVAWLRRRPLLHVEDGFVLVHAGLPPQWSLPMARRLCAQASRQVAERSSDRFFRTHMYGDEPRRWSPALEGWERLRFVINCCTRLRMVDADGAVELRYKGTPAASAGLIPWFRATGRKSARHTLLFGHWSLLGRVHWPRQRVWGLDTGCVWGGKLTALRLEDRRLFSVPGKRYSIPD